MDQGPDTLAVFADGSARYINQAGSLLVWDRGSEQSDALIRHILDVAQPLVDRLPLRRRDPGALPARLEYRFTLLTRSGTYIGTGARIEEPSTPAIGTLLAAGARNGGFLSGRSTQTPGR